MGIERPEASLTSDPNLLCVYTNEPIPLTCPRINYIRITELGPAPACRESRGLSIGIQRPCGTPEERERRLSSEGWAPIQAQPLLCPPSPAPKAGKRKQQLLSRGEHRHRSTWHSWDFHKARPSLNTQQQPGESLGRQQERWRWSEKVAGVEAAL